jgi:hypothetical protein
MTMAKGQKRGNRELKKPKATKPAAAPAATSLASKGVLAANPFKKKI